MRVSKKACVIAECMLHILWPDGVRPALLISFPPLCVAFYAGLATAAIGNGLAFVVLVYATAGISGGHLNPAISTAFVVTGRC